MRARRIVAGGLMLLLALALQTAPIALPAKAQPGWRLNLYPDGHAFAFTIVHDADSAYSLRLAPLFEEFDALNLKITATLFVSWADWEHGGQIWSTWAAAPGSRAAFFGPQAVPLVDPHEREFYLALASRGHEIGMHTASDSSDTTEDLERAFVYFSQVFGHPPTIYVEHSSKSNKETLQNQGGDPKSKYYSAEILNRYRPWVWVDGPMGLPSPQERYYFDLADFQGPPFNDEASKRYGIAKVFMRTGRWKDSNGDGFLEWYSKVNIDTLERDRGVALVYTHLNEKWLDAKTERMREPLRDRLRYIASKNGWFVPAGTILDRIALMKNVLFHKEGTHIRIENRNIVAVTSVAVIPPDDSSLCRSDAIFRRGPPGDIPIGSIRRGEVLDFEICH
jgi:peptidoglycan/xylan/chitin deacetylase (PgdA/CDA1 family)